jgi:hypothetical protein
MNNLWRPNLAGNSNLSQLIKNLESQGCELTHFEKSFTVFMPGLDILILSALSASPLPVSEEWVRSARVCLWDRAELKFNRHDQTIECRWIYWSPVQVFMHAAVWALFLLKIFTLPETTFSNVGLLLLGCGIANGLAFFLSWREERRLNGLFLASGFVSS